MDNDRSNRDNREVLAESPSKVVVQATPPTSGRRSSDLLVALVKGFWLILVGVILGVGVASLVSQVLPPVYRSEVHLLVIRTSGGPAASTVMLGTYAHTYGEFATAPEVVGDDVKDTGIVDPQRLEEVVNTEVSTDSPMFKVTTSLRDPEDAAELANVIGFSIEDRTINLGDETGYRAKVVARADPAERAAWPNSMLNIAVGAGIGLLLGVISALIWDDRRRASYKR
jgi:polysaccharide biosynthesis transport protein